MFRDKGQKARKGMDSSRHEDHEQIDRRLDLNCCWGSPHYESKCPESVARKGERDDPAAAKPGSKIQDIGHPFYRKIDALHQRNLFEAVFESRHEALTDNMVGHKADDKKEEHQEQQAESGDWIGHVLTDKVVQRFEEGRENQERGPCGDKDKESGNKHSPECLNHEDETR